MYRTNYLKPFQLHFFAIGFIFFHGLTFFSKFGPDEINQTLEYLAGRFLPLPTLYQADVLAFKSQLSLVSLFNRVAHFTPIDGPLINVGLFILASLFAFYGTYLALNKVGISRFYCFLGSLSLVIAFPFSYLAYGYHFKVGAASISFGSLAFATMVLGMGLLKSGKILVASILSIFILSFHPLNAILYLAATSCICFFCFSKRKTWIPILFLFGVMFYSYFYGVQTSIGSHPETLWNIIQLINGTNASTGYFLPWLNLNRLFQEMIFVVSILGIGVWSYKQKYLSKETFLFCMSFWGFSVFLAILHYSLSFLDTKIFMIFDFSRMLALLRPLGFWLVLEVIYKVNRSPSYLQLDKIPVFLLVFFLYPNFSVWLLPILFFFLFFKPFSTKYFLAILALITLLGLIKDGILFEPHILIRLAVLLSLSVYCFRFYKLPRVFLAYVLVCITIFNYSRGTINRFHENQTRDRSFTELGDFMKTQIKANNGIVLTYDEEFSRSATLSPSFIAFHSLSYAIYSGTLEKAISEMNLIWDIDLNNKKTLQIINDYQNKGGLNGYFEDFLAHLSIERLRRIRTHFPQFRYVLTKHDFIFLDSKIPLKTVFQNEKFLLYEINI